MRLGGYLTASPVLTILLLCLSCLGIASAQAQQSGNFTPEEIGRIYTSVATQNEIDRTRDETLREAFREIDALEAEVAALEARGQSLGSRPQEINALKTSVVVSLQQNNPRYANTIGQYRRVLNFISQASSPEDALARLAARGEAGRNDIALLVEQTANLNIAAQSDDRLILLRALALTLLGETDPNSHTTSQYFEESVELFQVLAQRQSKDESIQMMLFSAGMRSAVALQEIGRLDQALLQAARAAVVLEETNLETTSPRDWFFWQGQVQIFYAQLYLQMNDIETASRRTDFAVLTNAELMRYDPNSPQTQQQTAIIAALLREVRGRANAPVKRSDAKGKSLTCEHQPVNLTLFLRDNY